MLNFDNLKKQAKQLVRWHRDGYYPVAQRIRLVLPRFRDMEDQEILHARFGLADARELLAREHGFATWEDALRSSKNENEVPKAVKKTTSTPRLLDAHPQVFVRDVEASCRFYVETLGFEVYFRYGQPAFYALVQRDGARLNLRHVHQPVLQREPERDLLSASMAVDNVKALYLAYRDAGAPMHQALQKQPWGLRDFIVRDPDGNLLHFSEAGS